MSKKNTILDFKDTIYNNPITEDEIVSEVNGIIKRTIGEEFCNWFEFQINNENEDYFEIKDYENKVKIIGNNGVCLATGLNHYLKYYCNIHIGQCGNQTNMPDKLVRVNKVIRKDCKVKLRYAYNYCTHSYSMAFWGYEEWQKELDWLALNGVNLVLDLTGQEEVWRRFLGEIGYSYEEIKEWLVGPAYFAWYYMGNMSGFGGPLPDTWFEDRTNLARTIQRKMKLLGMKPVLQGYGGMIPSSIEKKIDGIKVIPQGLWCSFERPWMLRTDSEDYDKLASLFYKCQSEVYGKDTSNFYAIDPFHEGGISDGIGEAVVYREVLDSMLEFDKNAVWVIQSWGGNPTQWALDGVSREKRDNLLVLDLYSELDPRWRGVSPAWGYKWNTPEFDGTPWIWNMLNNFGGRMGLHGQLEVINTGIIEAYNNSKKMMGIGITPEATETNPILFDLLFEMAWNTEEVDLDKWIECYITRRYGAYSDNAFEAWRKFRNTVYKTRSDYHQGAPESLINSRPKFDIIAASTWGSSEVVYDKLEFEQGVSLLLKDYDKLCTSQGYLFDITDCLRQVVSNTAQEYYWRFTEGYKTKNYDTFKEYSKKFLEIIDIQEKILSTRPEFLLGRWIEAARTLAHDKDSKDLFEINAKALVTTWGEYDQSEIGGLHDYSNRQWSGLTGDFYKKRWEIWIEELNKGLEENIDIREIDWFNWEWNWVIEKVHYTASPSKYSLLELSKEVFEKFSLL